MDTPATGPFTRADFSAVSKLALEAWSAGVDADWSVPAGTLEWSCLQTADHVIDSLFSYAFWLASGNQESHPYYGELHARDGATPKTMIEGLRAVTTMFSAVIAVPPPETVGFLWGRPSVKTGNLDDFAARGGLELIQHAHDVSSGLGAAFNPPADACRRLFDHTENWPWHSKTERTSDAWADLLALTGRPRP